MPSISPLRTSIATHLRATCKELGPSLDIPCDWSRCPDTMRSLGTIASECGQQDGGLILRHEGGVRKPFIPYFRGISQDLGTANTEVQVNRIPVPALRGIAAKSYATGKLVPKNDLASATEDVKSQDVSKICFIVLNLIESYLSL